VPDDRKLTAVSAPTDHSTGTSAGAADSADNGGGALDAVAEDLYGVLPDDFVAERDAAAARARESGDRELAKAIGRLRRPTRAAWLANLLARYRSEQLDGLLGLAAGLADAQRTLDGAALRRLSSTRHQLVAAMAREAGRLAMEAGDPAAESVLRELQGILEAALARPDIAEQVRSGRLTRTVSYTGFGPEADPGTEPTAVPRAATPPPPAAAEFTETERAERERAERERERAERERRERALAEAEAEEEAARDRQQADEDARDAAMEERDAARDRVAELTAELDAARDRERAAAAAAREAEAIAKASARAAGAAAGRTARARARLDEA
jgi:hypothetical protein